MTTRNYLELLGITQNSCFFISINRKKSKVSASCSRPYALRRPKLVCFPALDSINQNTTTLKSPKILWSFFGKCSLEFAGYVKSKTRWKDSKGYTTYRRYHIIWNGKKSYDFLPKLPWQDVLHCRFLKENAALPILFYWLDLLLSLLA